MFKKTETFADKVENALKEKKQWYPNEL
jgi:hypothetical protein